MSIRALNWVRWQDLVSALLQEIARQLRDTKAALQRSRESFNSIVAYFGENAASMSSDGEFWRDIAAFVRAYSQAQRDFMQHQQV